MVTIITIINVQQVVFIPNYNVSLAELIVPASDIRFVALLLILNNSNNHNTIIASKTAVTTMSFLKTITVTTLYTLCIIY
jgi:hypothetical protein